MGGYGSGMARRSVFDPLEISKIMLVRRAEHARRAARGPPAPARLRSEARLRGGDARMDGRGLEAGGVQFAERDILLHQGQRATDG